MEKKLVMMERFGDFMNRMQSENPDEFSEKSEALIRYETQKSTNDKLEERKRQ